MGSKDKGAKRESRKPKASKKAKVATTPLMPRPAAPAQTPSGADHT